MFYHSALADTAVSKTGIWTGYGIRTSFMRWIKVFNHNHSTYWNFLDEEKCVFGYIFWFTLLNDVGCDISINWHRLKIKLHDKKIYYNIVL